MSASGPTRPARDAAVEGTEGLVLPDPEPTTALRVRLARAADRLVPLPAQPHLQLLWVLLLTSALLRLLWLDRPDGSLIFDESYYVNAARVILGIPPDPERYQDRPFGLDPNTEHPPLAKLLVAGSMALLGDNAYGWRLPSVVFGTAVILLLYGVARRAGANPHTSLLAAALLAFDNLVFVHGRIFTLDIFQLAFMLLGLYWYLGGRAVLAGVGFALAAVCKIGGAFGLPALVLYEVLLLVRGERPWRAAWRPAARRLASLSVVFAVAFFLALGVLDRLWVGYTNPVEHLQRILTYGQVLRRDIPSGIESYPWQWLWNDVQIPYLKVEQQVMVDDELLENRPLVLFLGAMNPFVLGLWPFGLSFAAWTWWHRRSGAAVGALALAWFAANYLPFLAASVFGHRISYLFYFLPTLPAVALAGACFLLRANLPRPVIWTYAVAVLLGFYGYFPFKPIP